MSTDKWAALIGLTGVIIGSVLSILNNWLKHHLRWRESRIDKARKQLLLTMLNDPDNRWRSLQVLTHVIGADEETTKRLLLEIGARGSENQRDVWGLVKRNPLPRQ